MGGWCARGSSNDDWDSYNNDNNSDSKGNLKKVRNCSKEAERNFLFVRWFVRETTKKKRRVWIGHWIYKTFYAVRLIGLMASSNRPSFFFSHLNHDDLDGGTRSITNWVTAVHRTTATAPLNRNRLWHWMEKDLDCTRGRRALWCCEICFSATKPQSWLPLFSFPPSMFAENKLPNDALPSSPHDDMLHVSHWPHTFLRQFVRSSSSPSFFPPINTTVFIPFSLSQAKTNGNFSYSALTRGGGRCILWIIFCLSILLR